MEPQGTGVNCKDALGRMKSELPQYTHRKAHGTELFFLNPGYNSSFGFPIAIIIILFSFSLFFTVPVCASFLSHHNKTKESSLIQSYHVLTEASLLFSIRNGNTVPRIWIISVLLACPSLPSPCPFCSLSLL